MPGAAARAGYCYCIPSNPWLSTPPNPMASDEELVDMEPCDVEEVPEDEAKPAVHRWVRAVLVVLTVPWIIVFIVAIQLYPYQDNGAPLRLGTHQQLGLPECNFKMFTGLPCP